MRPHELPAYPDRHEVFARHGNTQIVRKRVMIRDEVTLQLLSAFEVAPSSDSSGWSITIREQVPDGLAARHPQGGHALFELEVKGAAQQLTHTFWLAPLER